MRTMIHPFEASKPEDYVFGLLGLANSDHRDIIKAIEADYTQDVISIFTIVTKRLIMLETNTGRIILEACEKKKVNSFPSWVVDWSAQSEHWFDYVDSPVGIEAPLKSILALQVNETALEGWMSDRIQVLFPSWRESMTELGTSMELFNT
jgi:hypothetical protein